MLPETGSPALIAERFELLDELGRGAVARTYRARDWRSGGIVALKRLHPELRSEPAVVDRFRREVELVRKFSHPHVVALHACLDVDDELWLVMDFHPGGDLADRLANAGPLPIEDVVVLGVQLAGALDAAHAAGIVHRDVKAANVLFGAGPRPDVRLVDFGLAHSAEASRLTAADVVVGTPASMAPETITDGHADPRSDLYALGVLLFQAATGDLPFAGETPYELMRQQLHEPPPPLRARRPDARAWVEAIVLRLLAKDPLDRPSTAAELRTSLLAADVESVTALAASGSRVCPRCGGWLVATVDVCADCGGRSVRLASRARGVAVVVTDERQTGARLRLHDHAALYRVIDELAPGWAPPRGKRRAPRIPCVVARDLTDESAAALVAQLRAAGLTASVREDYRRDWDVRSKRGAMVKRYFSLWVGGIGLATQVINRVHSEALAVVFGCGLVASCVATTVAARRAAFRPLLAPGPARDTPAALLRIGHAMAGLRARHDRRLLGRLCERLDRAAHDVGVDAAGPITENVAAWAHALVAVEAAAAAQPELAGRPGEVSVAFLRDAERRRVEVRQRLLAISASLDQLLGRAALANARGGRDAAESLRAELRELQLETDARSEVAGLLAGT